MLEAALFPRKLASNFFFIFRLFYYILYWIQIQIRFRNRIRNRNPTVMYSGFGYAKVKSYGSFGSSSTTLHPEHYYTSSE